jgi:hypothetical protein
MSNEPSNTDIVVAATDLEKATVVQQNATLITSNYNVIRFRNRPMVLIEEPYPHYIPLHKENFDRMVYPLLGGVSRSRMSDVYSYVSHTAVDHSVNDNLILFGLTAVDNEREGMMKPANRAEKGITTVWDMDELSISEAPPTYCVWRSPYAKIISPKDDKGERVPIKFIVDLAGGDMGLYDDIMQSMAPIIMSKKPDGVIWWVGDGANGKSTLMDALYKIFPGQLSSLTVKRLTDGRDTPSLNGTLANIVKESSEGRIDDTEIYKSIGTHEDFRVHKFHSQDDIEIRGNLHHIFSANTIPTFNDKGYSARRRTFVVPFGQRFQSDPSFEEVTFTPEFFGQLIQELSIYAIRIKKQGYRYKWSATTLAAKALYDAEASNAEEYARSIIDEGVVAFESFNPVRTDYDNWCADMGYVPLGVGNLRRALQGLGFERMSARTSDVVTKMYRLFTVAGFQPQPKVVEPPIFGEKEPPRVKPEPKPKKSILNGNW